MENNSFTFWANMKEAIDVYEGNPEFQYKMYDALTEFALYGVWPEDDGSMESKSLISFVQTMVPSIEKSSGYIKKCAESGASGGRKQKISDSQIEEAIRAAAVKLNGIPTRGDVVAAVFELYGIKIDAKTVSRRFPDAQKIEIAQGALGQNRDIRTKQGQNENVPEGQNGDKTYVPEGHKDKINVPERQNKCPPVFNF